MTSDRRFDQDLPDLLAQLARRRHPDYRDHIVQQTARMRQRPAWMFPERWLPCLPSPLVRPHSRGSTAGRRPPCCGLLALVVGALLVAGSRPRVPPPFGLAANGLVAYEPAVTSTPSIRSPGRRPPWSPGRSTTSHPCSPGATSPSNARRWAPPARACCTSRGSWSRAHRGHAGTAPADPDVSFSPEGRELLFTSEAQDQHRQIHIAQTDGTGFASSTSGRRAARPPAAPRRRGDPVLREARRGGSRAQPVRDRRPHERSADHRSDHYGERARRHSWSPDDPGSPTSIGWTTRVVRAITASTSWAQNGTGDITLPLPPDAVCDGAPHWSNGGSRLVILRNYSPTLTDTVLAIVPADGSGLGIETDHGICCLNTEWSPDDTSILITPEDQAGAPLPPVIVDPATGAMAPDPGRHHDPAAA